MAEFTYTEEVTGSIVNIPVDLLHFHHDNPRKALGDISELTESIKAKGVLQNLMVVPFWNKNTGRGADDPQRQAALGYLVVIGNRRLAAATAAGLKTLPCIIASMTPAEQLQTMLVENMQRSDLTVFEQAQGFQLMLDFGDSVETVAEKTGFSQTTVRRRLKMAELDPKKLKTVSTRQISLIDFDKLSQIKDLSERNKVLDDIGTQNFERSIKIALESQKRKNYEDEWRRVLLEKGLKEIQYSETFSGKYCSCEKAYCEMGTVAAAEYVFAGDEIYFSFCYNTVYFRRDGTKADNQKFVERERINAINRAHKKKIDDAVERAYELRHDFLFAVSEPEARKQANKIIEFTIRKKWEESAGGYNVRYVHEVFLNRKVTEEQEPEGYALIEEQVHTQPFVSLLRHAYTSWSDNNKLGYFNYNDNYADNKRLDIIYDFLLSIGYEMSEEEKTLQDGTNPLFAESTVPRENDDEDYDDDEDEEYDEDDEE